MIDIHDFPAAPTDRFHQHLRVEQRADGFTPCWVWQHRRSINGYGRFYIDGREVAAHRFAFQLYARPISARARLDHLCRVRQCCNPSHLEVVTVAENNRRSNCVSGANARKTHCKRGHPLNGRDAKIKRRSDGRRECMRCQALREQREHEQQLVADFERAMEKE